MGKRLLSQQALYLRLHLQGVLVWTEPCYRPALAVAEELGVIPLDAGGAQEAFRGVAQELVQRCTARPIDLDLVKQREAVADRAPLGGGIRGDFIQRAWLLRCKLVAGEQEHTET